MANVHISDLSMMTRTEFLIALYGHEVTQEWAEVVKHRCDRSLLREWAAHKLLYCLHLWRSHTQSVDLNYPQKWYVRVAYLIVGSIGLVFYR